MSRGAWLRLCKYCRDGSLPDPGDAYRPNFGQYLAPDPAWPTAGGIARGTVSTRFRCAPVPGPGETVTHISCHPSPQSFVMKITLLLISALAAFTVQAAALEYQNPV